MTEGLAGELMALAEGYLFPHHERIWLVTDGYGDIRANGFYQRLGWEQVGRGDERDVRQEKGR